MVLVVFRSRQQPGNDAELERTGMAMYELAAAMPGFISYNEYSAADGESLALVQFESHETLAAWRDHPAHRDAQAAGRTHLFSEYHIQVCEVVRESVFPPR